MVRQIEACLRLPVKHHTKCSYGKMGAQTASGVWSEVARSFRLDLCPVSYTCSHINLWWGQCIIFLGLRSGIYGAQSEISITPLDCAGDCADFPWHEKMSLASSSESEEEGEEREGRSRFYGCEEFRGFAFIFGSARTSRISGVVLFGQLNWETSWRERKL